MPRLSPAHASGAACVARVQSARYTRPVMSRTHSSWLVLLTLVANFIYPTLMPVGEALATRMVVQAHLDYGKVRLCGSFAFIVASTLVGALVEPGPRA